VKNAGDELEIDSTCDKEWRWWTRAYVRQRSTFRLLATTCWSGGARKTSYTILYSVSQKNPPPTVFWIFSQTV